VDTVLKDIVSEAESIPTHPATYLDFLDYLLGLDIFKTQWKNSRYQYAVKGVLACLTKLRMEGLKRIILDNQSMYAVVKIGAVLPTSCRWSVGHPEYRRGRKVRFVTDYRVTKVTMSLWCHRNAELPNQNIYWAKKYFLVQDDVLSGCLNPLITLK
jgi:hypothetical protein